MIFFFPGLFQSLEERVKQGFGMSQMYDFFSWFVPITWGTCQNRVLVCHKCMIFFFLVCSNHLRNVLKQGFGMTQMYDFFPGLFQSLEERVKTGFWYVTNV